MFDLLFQLREDPTYFQTGAFLPGDYFKSLQMIWTESDICRTEPPPYNPCKEFTA